MWGAKHQQSQRKAAPRQRRARFTLRRLLWWLSGILGVLVVAALAAALSSPLWLNADTIKERLLAQIRRSVPGELGYQALELEFFPRPGLALQDIRWVLAGRIEARVTLAEVRLAWLPLLTGQVRVGAVRLTAPRIAMLLPEGDPSERLTPEGIDARLRAGFDLLAAFAPSMDLEVTHGELDMRLAQGSTLTLRNLDASFASRPDHAELSLRASADAVERIAAELRLARETLAGSIELDLTGMRLAALQGLLSAQTEAFGIEGRGDAHLVGTMRGASQWSLDVDANAAQLQLAGAGRPQRIEGATLKGTAANADGSLSVTLDSLASAVPRLAASGAFSATKDGYAARVQAGQLALSEWWPLIEEFAPQLAAAVRSHVAGLDGTVDSIELAAHADALGELRRADRWNASVAFEQLAFDLPRWELAVRELAGEAKYADGVLRIEPLQGSVGASRVRNADISIGLVESAHPLEGRIALALELGEVLRLARSALRTEPARRQLARLKRLEGRVLADVKLDGTLQAPLPAVTLSQPEVRVVHDGLPYALSISGGTARYDGGVLSLQGLAGRLGGSTLSTLTGTLELRSPYRLRVSDGQSELDLAELYRWLAQLPAIAPQLEGYIVQSGRAAVSLASMEGTLDAPARLRCRGEMVPTQVAIRVRALQDTLRLDGGALRIESEALTASQLGATVLGSDLRLGGRAERFEKGWRLRRAEVSGKVDRPLLDWVQTHYSVPAQARPVAPLELDRVRIEMPAEGASIVQGGLRSPEGARVDFDLRREADGRVELTRATVRDDQSDATARGTFGKRHVRVAFAGALAAASVRRLLPAAPLPLRSLRGDFALDLDLDRPHATRARGHLQGEGLDWSGAAALPWRIERFSLAADGAMLRIESARIEGEGTDAALSGTVATAEDRYIVDLLLHGKSLVMPAWTHHSADAAQAAPDADERTALPRLLAADLPVWGSVRVDLARVDISHFQVTPLIAAGKLENGHLDLVVQRAALCGVALQARLTARPGQAHLEGGLSSRGARVEAGWESD